MSQTSRERVTRSLRFEYPDRLPRDMGVLPWAGDRFSTEIAAISQPSTPSYSAWIWRICAGARKGVSPSGARLIGNMS